MADNIIKQTDNIDPLDQMALAGLVDFNPPKQTNQRMPDKSAYPFSPAPVAKQPTAPTNPVVQERIVGPSRCPLPTKPNSKPTPKPSRTIEADLAEVVEVWTRYRSTNGRDAVYMYLEMVFAVVRRWQRLECSKKNSRAILRLRNGARRKRRVEAFSILIFCTADPKVADAKTISKWSRALRFARIAKPADQPLTAFIKSKGGINECARRFARKSRIKATDKKM